MEVIQDGKFFGCWGEASWKLRLNGYYRSLKYSGVTALAEYFPSFGLVVFL